MSNKIQIVELNQYVKTTLAPSKIHGVGVVALRDIKKGQKLYSDMVPKIYTLPYKYFGKLFKNVGELILSHWPLAAKGSNFAYPVTRMQAWLNHSDDPNYDAVKDIVLKDIKEGEEITEDYRKIEGWEEIYPFIKK